MWFEIQKPQHDAKVLDKILTNMHTHYKSPVVLPALGRSDHEVVCFPLPAYATPVPKHHLVVTRSSGQNQRTLFADALIKND